MAVDQFEKNKDQRIGSATVPPDLNDIHVLYIYFTHCDRMWGGLCTNFTAMMGDLCKNVGAVLIASYADLDGQVHTMDMDIDCIMCPS